MKRILIFILPLLITVLSSAHAGIWGESVGFNDLSDQRNFSSPSYNPSLSEGGVSGYWPYSFSIEWNVSYDIDTMLWTYQYTISAIKKDVSHFILELSSDVMQDDISNLMINGATATFGINVEGPDMWGQHPSNPGYPNSTDMYGIKFDSGGNPVTYSLTTANDPVWGHFYLKGGKDNGNWIHAYNNALAQNNFDSNNKLDFIVRPDGGSTPPVVPEPVSSALFITGGLLFGSKRLFGLLRHHAK